NHAITAVRRLRCGTVNINEVPGYRVENSPFGGIKDSGLGVKEGVIEAVRAYSYVKTFSIPWGAARTRAAGRAARLDAIAAPTRTVPLALRTSGQSHARACRGR